MAMAEVFFPDCDDYLSGGYPRAPPPSPEMQPRNHSRVFEIPASKFEGIGLDMRRNTFPLLDEDEDESPLGLPEGAHHHLGGPTTSYDEEEEVRGSLPVHSRDFDDDNSLPGSPQKRVCCSPRILPNEFVTTVFPSFSNEDSLVSSGFGSFQLPPLHISTGGGFRSNPGSSSPYIRSSRLCPQTSPGSVAEGLMGAVQENTNQCTPALYPVTTPSHQDHTLLSRSYDLHSIHPHLPRSFETTQLPEVRPTRSRTLDSTAYHPLGLEPDNLDAGCGAQDPNQRRRKISVKRKNPDEDAGDDPNLQFSFEYSYSSTGSGEADWVMVDCKMDSSLPIGKKACCADDPSSVAVSHQKELQTSPLHGTPLSSFSPGGRPGLFGGPPRLNPLDPPSSGSSTSTGFSPFAANVATTASHFTGRVGVPFDRVDTPTNHYPNLQNFESLTVMDNEVMECEQFQTNSPSLSPYSDRATSVFGGVVSGHMTQGDGVVSINTPLLGMEHGLAVMRPRHREDATLGPVHSAALRHSCVEEYLQSHRGQGWSGGVETGLGLNGDDLDATRLNLSKSL